MTEDESVAVHALRVAVEDLARVVGDLADRVTTTEDIQKDLASQRRINGWLAGSIAFDILLSFAFGFVLWRAQDNSDDISELQERTSNKVLCPIVGIFIASTQDLPPDAADTNEDGVVTEAEEQTLANTIQVIQNAYAELNCPKPKSAA